MILNDEDRANDTKVHSEDAFTAQRGKLKLQNKRGHIDKCPHCQEKGHFAKNCSRKTKNESGKTSQTGSGVLGCSMCRRRIFNS